MDLLNVFNILSLIVFVGLGLLAGARMIWRLGNFMFFGYPVPVLLKRDIVLFSSLFLYFGSVLVILLIGAPNLGREPLWVIPRGLMVLSAMAYWVWVEYHLEDGRKKD
jgi:hypothetical protein